jgi:hypothetical protein
MRTSRGLGLVLVGLAGIGALVVFLVAGCGGSDGGPPTGLTVADAGGTWYGPMGTTTSMGGPLPPTSTGAITIDGGGAITGFTLDGIVQPAVGQVTGVLSEPHRVFSILLNGARGILVQSADGRHMLYVDETFQFAALEKDGMPPAVPYSDGDVQGTTWSGSALRVSALMAPQVLESLSGANIDGGGMFNYAAGGSTNSGGPLLVVPGSTNGQYQGPFMISVPPGSVGMVLGLLTPDKAFLATLSGWGPTVEDLEVAAWKRN